METPDSTLRRRPRFSLLNLLLFTAVVALSLALWGETSRRWPLEREIKSLRLEVGEVTVPNPTRMYVQPLDLSVSSEMHFRWRAYVPPERGGEVIVEVLQPSKNRKGYLTMTLKAGESGFELVTLPPVSGTQWMYQLRDPASVRRGGTSNPRPPWLGSHNKVEGAEFNDYDPKPGLAEGQEAVLLDLSGESEDGEPIRVSVIAKLYPQGQMPANSSGAGHRKIDKSKP